jgi:hypothetical protein
MASSLTESGGLTKTGGLTNPGGLSQSGSPPSPPPSFTASLRFNDARNSQYWMFFI